MYKGKNVLITGSYGFVGSNLAEKLVNLGAIVNTFVKKDSEKWRVNNFLKKLAEHNVNLGNPQILKKIILKIKPQIIFHLASHGGHHFQKDPDKIIKTNLIGTINLLTSLKDINYEFFINTGSSSEYGFKNKPMKETDSLEPVSFYAATKAGATLLCQAYAKNLGKPIATIRPFTVYGPLDTPTKLIPTAIINCLKGRTLQLTSGTERHDYIFVDDVVSAYLKVAQNPKLSGEIINIGSGKQYSNEEVVKKIAKICNKHLKIKMGAYSRHSWDTNYWVANIAKAKKLLGWEPEYSLEDGLKKTIDWFKDNIKYYE